MTSPFKELFEKAKEKARKKLEGDRAAVSAKLGPVFEAISENLFDPTFNVNALQRSGVLTAGQIARFRRELGRSVKPYLDEMKEIAATWLLLETDLSIRQIANLFHYRKRQNFTRDFRRLTNRSPSELRKEKGWGTPSATRPFKIPLIPSPESLFVYLGGSNDRAVARAIWKVVRGETLTMARKALEGEIVFGTPALFELLSEESRKAAQTSRTRGVEIARLAAATVEGSALVFGARYPEMRALALARLGNAHVLALEFPAAMRAFAASRDALPRRATPRVEAEIFALEGTMFLFQRRFPEDLRALERALELAREAEAHALQADILVQLSSAFWYRGRLDEMVGSLEHAGSVVRDHLSADRGRICDVQHQLILALTEAGRFTEAALLLPAAQELAHKLEKPTTEAQLGWIEGLIAKARGNLDQAERLIRTARAVFVDLADIDTASLAGFDLAILCQEQGRVAEARGLVEEILPAFEKIGPEREVLAAAELLRRAVVSEIEIPVTTLHWARRVCRARSKAPNS